MDNLKGQDVLVLGGAGLVGMATCRLLFREQVNSIIVSSLTEAEVLQAKQQLEHEYPNSPTKIYTESGNIFVRADYRYASRKEIFQDEVIRRQVVADVLDPLCEEILAHSTLTGMFRRHKPDIVIDCINSATSFAYQDIFTTSQGIRDRMASAGGDSSVLGPDFLAQVEILMGTQYIPQLIRHIQILLAASKQAGTKMYLKVGTSGTGGMGLNIPYTHSEDKPSRMLMSKSAIAGAHTLMLFLMARTPDAPIIKEVKPTAAIAWKRIAYGPIPYGGKPRLLEDCDLEQPYLLEGIMAKELPERVYYQKAGRPQPMEAPFIDTGENGVFALGEFEALTDDEQMEFITPEEIAQCVIWEIKGRNSGFDIINSLDHTTMGPTYRAGFMRRSALVQLRALEAEHGVPSVAFELLGPPRNSKLLWEAHLLRTVYGTMRAVLEFPAEALSRRIHQFLTEDDRIRSTILTVGLPILLPDGKGLWRGSSILIPVISPFAKNLSITPASIDRWAHDGWIDLRVPNFERWRERFRTILRQLDALDPRDTSSTVSKNRHYWFEDGDETINIGKTVSWIYINEEAGERMKT
ncbi:MAG: hypothetical protein A2284_03870 [Deltaproteobacteria bacterium RIFOXYA12_FULL_61_11]|nr:MAG: hypothetical protein A2284_03870 [Deltaproteobacteria bacterium RIFOXYA12_FULL_61_11]